MYEEGCIQLTVYQKYIRSGCTVGKNMNLLDIVQETYCMKHPDSLKLIMVGLNRVEIRNQLYYFVTEYREYPKFKNQ